LIQIAAPDKSSNAAKEGNHMNQEISDTDLLRVAYDDELFRKELRRQSGKEWRQLLAALKSGTEHPSAKVAVEWIKQIVDESRDEIATFIAKQDFGEYPICVFGFDQLCSIWVPEFDSHGPFLSHDDAIGFVQSEWSEFLISDEVTLNRFPGSRSADKAAMARARRAVKKTPLVRYHLEHHEYSRVGTDKYLRHPRRQSEVGPPISGTQLAGLLVTKNGGISEELRGQLQATGWDQLISKIDRVVERKRKKYEAETAKSNAAFTKAVVKFFDEFLDGRDNKDANLLDAAARAWVWRGFDLAEDHPDYEDRAGGIQRYARQRHYEALHSYINAKQKLTHKKRTCGKG
jgi:hypothetical protein